MDKADFINIIENLYIETGEGEMIKFWKRTILSILAILLINSVPVYASEVFYWNGIEVIDDDDESIILPEKCTVFKKCS